MSTHDDRPTGADTHRVHCQVVTPEKVILDLAADFVAVPLYDGELGVLPGHTPLIGRLGSGELRARVGSVEHSFFIDRGFVQIRDNAVSVLTSHAVPVDQIEVAAATAELEKAQAIVATTDEKRAQKQHALERARAMLRLVSRDA